MLLDAGKRRGCDRQIVTGDPARAVAEAAHTRRTRTDAGGAPTSKSAAEHFNCTGAGDRERFNRIGAGETLGEVILPAHRLIGCSQGTGDVLRPHLGDAHPPQVSDATPTVRGGDKPIHRARCVVFVAPALQVDDCWCATSLKLPAWCLALCAR